MRESMHYLESDWPPRIKFKRTTSGHAALGDVENGGIQWPSATKPETSHLPAEYGIDRQR